MENIVSIALDLIVPSKLNPRKTFNEESIKELAESIASSGLQQPIKVRPVNGKMEIIFGERRYRACKLLGLKSIMGNIEEMSDQDALLLMTIENEQREQVPPLEQARAYGELYKKGKGMTYQEIAAKVGQTPTFVARRIQLLLAIPFFLDLFEKGKIDFNFLLTIGKYSQEIQQDVAKWAKNYYGGLNLKATEQYIRDNLTYSLAKAPFKTTDPDLVPKMGACTTCPFNTANQGVLFGDVKTGTCTKKSCFDEKRNISAFNKINAQLVKEPETIFCMEQYGNNREMLESICKQLGITALSMSDFTDVKDQLLDKPEKEKIKKEWLENKRNADDKDAWKEVFASEMEDYTDSVKIHDQMMDSGKTLTVYMLNGDYANRKRIIIPDNWNRKTPTQQSAKEDLQVAKATGDEHAQARASIEVLKAKKKRNIELSQEKTYKELVDQLRELKYGITHTQTLNTGEQEVFYAMLLEGLDDYAGGDQLKKELKLNSYHEDDKMQYLLAAQKLTSEQKNKVIRLWISEKLRARSATCIYNYQSYVMGAGIIALANNSEMANDVMRVRKEYLDKQNSRLDERIKELKESLPKESKKEAQPA